MDDSIVLGNRNPLSQLLILVGIAFLSVAVFSFIPILLAQPLFGINAFGNLNLFSQTSNPQVLALLKFMQVMQSIGFFVVPPLIFSLIYYRGISVYLQLKFNFKGSTSILIVLIMLSAMPAINWLGELNSYLKLPDALRGIESWMKRMEADAEILTKTFLVMHSFSEFLLNLTMIALIPALGEELLFRGAFQTLFGKITGNKHAGIWISAIIFSAMHMQFYGFIPRMLLGALFGYTVLWTGSLWIPIIGHFVNNGSAVIISYLEQKGKINTSIETVGTGTNGLLYVIGSFVLVAVLMYYMKLNSAHSGSYQVGEIN